MLPVQCRGFAAQGLKSGPHHGLPRQPLQQQQPQREARAPIAAALRHAGRGCSRRLWRGWRQGEGPGYAAPPAPVPAQVSHPAAKLLGPHDRGAGRRCIFAAYAAASRLLRSKIPGGTTGGVEGDVSAAEGHLPLSPARKTTCRCENTPPTHSNCATGRRPSVSLAGRRRVSSILPTARPRPHDPTQVPREAGGAQGAREAIQTAFP